MNKRIRLISILFAFAVLTACSDTEEVHKENVELVQESTNNEGESSQVNKVEDEDSVVEVKELANGITQDLQSGIEYENFYVKDKNGGLVEETLKFNPDMPILGELKVEKEGEIEYVSAIAYQGKIYSEKSDFAQAYISSAIAQSFEDIKIEDYQIHVKNARNEVLDLIIPVGFDLTSFIPKNVDENLRTLPPDTNLLTPNGEDLETLTFAQLNSQDITSFLEQSTADLTIMKYETNDGQTINFLSEIYLVPRNGYVTVESDDAE